jgi:predicted Zn finger-like uncharacterized protein
MSFFMAARILCNHPRVRAALEARNACYRRFGRGRSVIIECPSCQARYQYDEDRFERKPSKKIKCARCKGIFEIQNPAFAPRTAPPAAHVGDSTFASREARPAAKPEATEQSPLPERPTAQDLQLPTGKRLSLAILGGNDAGSVYRIEKPRVTIGRSGADLTLNDTEASRQHAVLEVRDSVITVADLGSTNGTLINGDKIQEAIELSDKAEFQVGATTLMLIVTEDH